LEHRNFKEIPMLKGKFFFKKGMDFNKIVRKGIV